MHDTRAPASGTLNDATTYAGSPSLAGIPGTNFNIPAAPSGFVNVVKSMSYKSWDGHPTFGYGGTDPADVPFRRRDRAEIGERWGVKIGSYMPEYLTAELPDVNPVNPSDPAISNAAEITGTLDQWNNQVITGTTIVIQHGSLYPAYAANPALLPFTGDIVYANSVGVAYR